MLRVCAVVSGLLCAAGAAGIAAPAEAAGYEQVYTFPFFARGQYPTGDLIVAGGQLYGTTSAGGGSSSGAVFSWAATGEKSLYVFNAARSGTTPTAGLLDVNGTLYGTTEDSAIGYATENGTVFAESRATGGETTLYSFQGGSDGQRPTGSLIDVGGVLYGTTRAGGGSTTCSNGCGTVFALNLTTGAEKVVYAFMGGNDGAEPAARLIEVNGRLYGTTLAGGSTLGTRTVAGPYSR